MKTIYNKILIVVMLLIFTTIWNYAQDSIFFFETKTPTLKKVDFEGKYRFKVNSVKEFYPISINKLKLSTNSINIKFEDKNIKLDKVKTKDNGIGIKTTKFESEKKEKIIVTSKDDDLVGTMIIDNRLFYITTFKDKKQYLVEIKDEGNCGNDENVTKGKPIEKLEFSEVTNSMLKSTTVNSCNLRILVMYTQAAEARFTANDIMLHIHNAIAIANEYMEGSEVFFEWELAWAGSTEYTEHNNPPIDERRLDRDDFHGNGDSFMDEVHNLREIYSADICVLLSDCVNNATGACGGIAVTIDAPGPADAFCLVHVFDWGGIRHLTFSHEIGHLIGCRHEYGTTLWSDNSTAPYAFGHGYVDYGSMFRTMMGADPTLTKIPYWSNPNIFRLAPGLPMGNAATSDCARVLRLEIPVKTRFLQPENNVVINSDDVIRIRYADIIAEETVTVNNANIPSNAEIKIRSDEITLNPGFTLELGAELELINEIVLDCP